MPMNEAELNNLCQQNKLELFALYRKYDDHWNERVRKFKEEGEPEPTLEEKYVLMLGQFDEIIETGGDSFARYMVRMKEMRQSLAIVEQLIDNIPEGDFLAKTKAVLKLPKGEFFSRVETARGDFGVYIVSEGGTTPYRIKFRSPGFSNLSALDRMARGGKIGDLVAIMGTLDLVIPDIDR